MCYLVAFNGKINQQEGLFQHHSGINQPVLAIRNRNVIVIALYLALSLHRSDYKQYYLLDVMLCSTTEVC
jgi:hypothetical protein